MVGVCVCVFMSLGRFHPWFVSITASHWPHIIVVMFLCRFHLIILCLWFCFCFYLVWCIYIYIPKFGFSVDFIFINSMWLSSYRNFTLIIHICGSASISISLDHYIPMILFLSQFYYDRYAYMVLGLSHDFILTHTHISDLVSIMFSLGSTYVILGSDMSASWSMYICSVVIIMVPL